MGVGISRLNFRGVGQQENIRDSEDSRLSYFRRWWGLGRLGVLPVQQESGQHTTEQIELDLMSETVRRSSSTVVSPHSVSSTTINAPATADTPQRRPETAFTRSTSTANNVETLEYAVFFGPNFVSRIAPMATCAIPPKPESIASLAQSNTESVSHQNHRRSSEEGTRRGQNEEQQRQQSPRQRPRSPNIRDLNTASPLPLLIPVLDGPMQNFLRWRSSKKNCKMPQSDLFDLLDPKHNVDSALIEAWTQSRWIKTSGPAVFNVHCDEFECLATIQRDSVSVNLLPNGKLGLSFVVDAKFPCRVTLYWIVQETLRTNKRIYVYSQDSALQKSGKSFELPAQLGQRIHVDDSYLVEEKDLMNQFEEVVVRLHGSPRPNQNVAESQRAPATLSSFTQSNMAIAKTTNLQTSNASKSNTQPALVSKSAFVTSAATGLFHKGAWKRPIYHFTILVVPIGPLRPFQISEVWTHVSINKNSARVIKQRAWCDGMPLLLNDVYGYPEQAEHKASVHDSNAGGEDVKGGPDESSDHENSSAAGQKNEILVSPVGPGLAQPECIICFSEEKCAILLPCRHLCLCRDCALQMRSRERRCPVCRQEYTTLLHLEYDEGTKKNEQRRIEEAWEQTQTFEQGKVILSKSPYPVIPSSLQRQCKMRKPDLEKL